MIIHLRRKCTEIVIEHDTLKVSLAGLGISAYAGFFFFHKIGFRLPYCRAAANTRAWNRKEASR